MRFRNELLMLKALQYLTEHEYDKHELGSPDRRDGALISNDLRDAIHSMEEEMKNNEYRDDM